MNRHEVEFETNETDVPSSAKCFYSTVVQPILNGRRRFHRNNVPRKWDTVTDGQVWKWDMVRDFEEGLPTLGHPRNIEPGMNSPFGCGGKPIPGPILPARVITYKHIQLYLSIATVSLFTLLPSIHNLKTTKLFTSFHVDKLCDNEIFICLGGTKVIFSGLSIVDCSNSKA